MKLTALDRGSLVLHTASGEAITIRRPVSAYGLAGRVICSHYDDLVVTPTRAVGRSAWIHEGVPLELADEWQGDGAAESLKLTRRLRAVSSEQTRSSGVQSAMKVELPADSSLRFFLPGMIYSPEQWSAENTHSYADDRLAYPIVGAFDGLAMITMERVAVATADALPTRSPGDTRFLQRTDIGSLGFDATVGQASLLTAWPYWEGNKSAMLNASGSPASALMPVGGDDGLDISLTYRLSITAAPDFNAAVRAVFGGVVDRVQPEPTEPAVTLEESIDLRLDSAARTFREVDGFAGFVLNFDPERGYESEAKAFGASFAEHAMSGSRDILEYGFTGRQLNLAYMLARRSPAEWGARGAQVVDSFISRMTTPSGWVHTLWGLGRQRPVYACGDPTGPMMHYLGPSSISGTYTRMMAEAGRDLVLNIQLHSFNPGVTASWQDAALRLGQFFLRVQEAAGSWYRAYAPAGPPIVGSHWVGYRS